MHPALSHRHTDTQTHRHTHTHNSRDYGKPLLIGKLDVEKAFDALKRPLLRILRKLGLPTPVGELGNSFDKFPNGAGLEIGAEAIDRFGEHLAENNVDTKKELGLVGPALTLDPKTERFQGERANEANQLLRKPPVEGFTVPDLA